MIIVSMLYNVFYALLYYSLFHISMNSSEGVLLIQLWENVANEREINAHVKLPLNCELNVVFGDSIRDILIILQKTSSHEPQAGMRLYLALIILGAREFKCIQIKSLWSCMVPLQGLKFLHSYCNVNDDSKFVYLSNSLIQPDYTMYKLQLTPDDSDFTR